MGQQQEIGIAQSMLGTFLESRDFVTHWKARVGAKGVPEMKELVESRDLAVAEKCASFIQRVIYDLELLSDDLDCREKQPELPLGGEPEKKEKVLKAKLTGKGKGKKASDAYKDQEAEEEEPAPASQEA